MLRFNAKAFAKDLVEHNSDEELFDLIDAIMLAKDSIEFNERIIDTAKENIEEIEYRQDSLPCDGCGHTLHVSLLRMNPEGSPFCRSCISSKNGWYHDSRE